MKAKKRQKLCYNCEGDIDLDVIVCPYCAADLREEKPELKEISTKSTVMHQMSHSLYPPTYPIREEEPLPVKPSPPPLSMDEETQEEESSEKISTVIGATLLFALGVTLFLLGMLLAIFSQEGQVTLRWDARVWFLYLFASLPFLVFGYRAVSKIK